MRIHHLNCGTCCPLGGRLFDGESEAAFGRLVCHCLLIESDAGLILVDTGFGIRDVTRPHERLSAFFLALNNIQLRPEETAIAQVRRLGFDPNDVRHIVISHLDFDHAGGIEDFPQATVHLLEDEMDAACRRRGGLMGSRRYRPQQWDEVADWRCYRAGEGEPWFGFQAVRDLDGLPPEILLVPLMGHTWGHSGVAICDAGSGGGWLFYAADAYFYRGEIGSRLYRCPPGLRTYQAMMEVDRSARLANQARLRRLSLTHEGEVRIFCAHDTVEFEILAADAPPAAVPVVGQGRGRRHEPALG
ncbi:MAG: MBL fold metallo-hydrolase [Rhodospirillales bacterium]|nr:MBL fold metallo-hydrolase [Rhodospirillales bacterium]